MQTCLSFRRMPTYSIFKRYLNLDRGEYRKHVKILDNCGKDVDRSKDNWTNQWKNYEKAKQQFEKVPKHISQN